MATTALFSASKQLHCTLVVRNPKWVTVPLHGMFWISTEVVTVLFSCYMAGATWNCCHLSTIQYTRLLCHFIQSHICRVHVFSCNLLHALLPDWPESFTFYCGKTGVEWIFYEYWSKSQHSWPCRKTCSCCSCQILPHALKAFSFSQLHWSCMSSYLSYWFWCSHTRPASCLESRHSTLNSFAVAAWVNTSHTGFLVSPYTSCLMPWKQAFYFKQLCCSCMSSYLSYFFSGVPIHILPHALKAGILP